MDQIRDVWLHAHQMIRSARQIINENLRPLNLSSAEGNILIHLMTLGNEVGQDQLVEQMDLSKPAISRALDSLELKGFVSRQPDAGDKRARRVHLTEKAISLCPELERVYNRVYALALQDISEDELNSFLSLFARMAANINRGQKMDEDVDAS
jgi:MarR family transcriptional regulator for hemolysin